MRNYIIRAIYATFTDICHSCTLTEIYAPFIFNNLELLWSVSGKYLGLFATCKELILYQPHIIAQKGISRRESRIPNIGLI